MSLLSFSLSSRRYFHCFFIGTLCKRGICYGIVLSVRQTDAKRPNVKSSNLTADALVFSRQTSLQTSDGASFPEVG